MIGNNNNAQAGWSYDEIKPNIIAGLKMAIYDLELYSEDKSTWWNFGAKILKGIASIPFQLKMGWDLSYLIKQVHVETGESIFTLVKTPNGMAKLISSKLFENLVQDEDIWNIIDPNKSVEIAKRYKYIFAGFGISEEQLDSFIPNSLKLVEDIAKKIATKKEEAAALIIKHKELLSGEVTEHTTKREELVSDAIKLANAVGLPDLLVQNNAVKEAVQNVALNLLPTAAYLQDDIINIFIPRASAKELLAALGSEQVVKLTKDIAGAVPNSLSNDPALSLAAMKTILPFALALNLNALTNYALLMKYLKDIQNNFNFIPKPMDEVTSYVFTYFENDGKILETAKLIKQIIPHLKELTPAVLKIYEYASAKQPSKQHFENLFSALISLAKKVDEPSLAYIIKTEMERNLYTQGLSEIIPPSLQKELVPFIAKLASKKLKENDIQSLPKYLAGFFSKEITNKKFALDAIKVLFEELKKDDGLKNDFIALIKNNQVVREGLAQLIANTMDNGEYADNVLAFTSKETIDLALQLFGDQVPAFMSSISRHLDKITSDNPKNKIIGNLLVTQEALGINFQGLADDNRRSAALVSIANKIKALPKPESENLEYLSSYLKTEEKIKKTSDLLKNLLPHIPQLKGDLLTLADFGMATSISEQQAKNAFRSAIVVAKKLDQKSLDYVIEIEMDRFLRKKGFNDIVSPELQKAIRPLVTQLAIKALKSDSLTKKLPAYIAEIWFNKLSPGQISFDAIDWAGSQFNDIKVLNSFKIFMRSENNKELLEEALETLFERNPLLKGQAPKIVAIFNNTEKFQTLINIYNHYKEKNYLKVGAEFLGEVLPIWRKSDIRSLFMHVILKFLHEMIYEFVYPNFIRRKIFGAYADQILQAAVNEASLNNTSKVALQSKFTLFETDDVFAKEYFANKMSFRGLDVNYNFKNLDISDFDFSKARFHKNFKLEGCDITRTSFRRASFVESTRKRKVEINDCFFDLETLESLIMALSKSGNMAKITNVSVSIPGKGTMSVQDNQLSIQVNAELSDGERRLVRNIALSGIVRGKDDDRVLANITAKPAKAHAERVQANKKQNQIVAPSA